MSDIDPVDAYLRRQIYIEGVKRHEADKFNATAEEIIAAVTLALISLGVASLDELPKKKLSSFVATVNNKIKTIFNKSAKLTTASMRKFMVADLTVNRSIISELTSKAAKGASVSAARLWATINNSPIGGTGQEPKNIMRVFFGSAGASIQNLIKRAWAEGWTVNELITNVVGSHNQRFKNGLLNKLRNQFGAAVNTWLQHISSFAMQAVASLFYERYQWVSVIDGSTTEICLERNGNVYEYGKGPRPPAHYRCRSTTMPVANKQALPTLSVWINKQPVAIRKELEIFMSAPASGGGFKMKSDGLSIDEYRKKSKSMLIRTEGTS